MSVRSQPTPLPMSPSPTERRWLSKEDSYLLSAFIANLRRFCEAVPWATDSVAPDPAPPTATRVTTNQVWAWERVP